MANTPSDAIGTEAGHRGEVAVGMAVVSRDGERLGVVKEVAPGYFKVDVRLKPDYWLQTEFARVTAAGQVVMEFGKDEVSQYKVKEPPSRVVDESMPMTAEAVRPEETAAGSAGAPPDEDTAPRPPA